MCASSPQAPTRQPSEANVPFEKTRGCFNMTPSDGRSITLPQELIDLILELTDQTTLKVCSRVASAFRYTSQRRLFSDLLLMRSRDRPHPIAGFSKILIRSPHLALHVRSLRILEDSFNPRPSTMSAQLSSILSMFVNLNKISIDSQSRLDWNSDVLAAFRDTIKSSTLTSVRIANSTFERSSQLISLLQSNRSLEFLALSRVGVQKIDMIEVDAGSQLRLRSLEIDLYPVMRSVTSVIDPQCLRHLRITAVLFEDLDSNTIQCLLDNASHLNHCHFHCPEICFTLNISAYSFRSHLRLQTLEFSVTDYWTPEMYDWAVGILSGVPNPSPVQHVILNVRVHLDMPWRSNFIGYLTHLQLVLTAPPVAPLRRVTVRLNSYDGSHIGVGIEQEIRDALPVLRDRGLLEVVLLERN
ncbi:hypothetical protein GGX14DRAFT_654269 [Mycena pura]|uniref:F-box domain-containing protein n=1 Tax=Mycena pura TaxID=153505 RepID=A0AAD6Y6R9_9AGAR|nr:hypothetical protein GGX14DRAFT_654269 [Mycena pura]